MSNLDLQEINAMTQEQFVNDLGPVFENSPWVAEGAWQRGPFESVADLHRAMFDVVSSSPRAQLLDFLNAHPELAGKEAQAGEMTNESVGEQSSAGLDALTAQELARMQQLNREYTAHHGFPFVIAVRGHTKESIFSEFERRKGQSTAAEFKDALAQIAIISRGRLDRLVSE
ncbi:uricase [Glutamicibacter uratoxydans]|uniref:2-oxo-4-hydroxy-4-carboxy-5-ureidoimidazoline decarboxylase n=1 Tax=Glutamicibacter uratoxydans TaxID=43667 RepID=A0A4Y4DLE5_GLUUR|nr:2-oxo-4-hydroxy-4-carboxy-5-ureidoimidazoline decarboxylase [Glutamicibacter uratoxydans]GED06142.1 uricase [Glutamicibacter uratoxydans]